MKKIDEQQLMAAWEQRAEDPDRYWSFAERAVEIALSSLPYWVRNQHGDDLAQEARIKLLLATDDFDPARCDLFGYLTSRSYRAFDGYLKSDRRHKHQEFEES